VVSGLLCGVEGLKKNEVRKVKENWVSITIK